MKTLVIAIGIGVLMLAVWAGFVFFNSGVAVEVAKVEFGNIQEYIDERGKTRLPRTYLVTMPYQGRISEIELTNDAGQTVRIEEGVKINEGVTVAKIVREDLELERRVAQAAVDRLDALIVENEDVEIEKSVKKQSQSFVDSMQHVVKASEKRTASGLARSEFTQFVFKRIQELLEHAETSSRIITLERFEAAKLKNIESQLDHQQYALVHQALQALQAATELLPRMVDQYIVRKNLQTVKLQKERDQAQSQFEQIELKLRRGVMKSPVTGVVLKRPYRNERHLPAGATLLEIASADDLYHNLEIEVDLLSQEAVKVNEGAQVEIRGPAIGEEPVFGTVVRKFPQGFTKISSLGVEQQRVRTIIRFDENVLIQLRKHKKALGVAYRVSLRIYTAKKQNVLLIPRSALFRGIGGGWQVYSVESGRAKLRDVTVGLINDERVEIVKGLAAGDLVVLAPETRLSDGARVSAGTQ